MKKSTPGLAAVLKWAAGVTGSALLFMLANRRTFDVGLSFAIWEITQQWRAIVLVLTIALSLPLVWLILWLSGVRFISPRMLLRQYEHVRIPVAVAALILFSLLLSPYLRARYHYFSQASFQMRAWTAFDAREFTKARSICTEYVSLYPQRRADGAWPDPVCVSILRFTDQMGIVGAYLKRRPPPQAAEVDGISLPVDFAIKGPAERVSRLLAGGRVASDDQGRHRPVHSTPSDKDKDKDKEND